MSAPQDGPSGESNVPPVADVKSAQEFDDLIGQAQAAMAQRDWPLAATCWRAIIEAQGTKTSARAYVGLAQAERQRGDLDAALAVADMGRVGHPKHPGILTELARIAMERQDWPKAAEHWNAIVEARGDRAPARAFAGLAQAEREQGNLVAALASANAGLALHPGQDGILTESARIATAQSDWPRAAELWRAVIQAQGDKAPARAFAALAQAERQQDNLVAAQAAIDAALAQYHARSDLLAEHARIAMANQDWPEAAGRWRAVLNAQDGAATSAVYAGWARAEWQQGNFAAAQAVVDAGLAQHPGQEGILTEKARIAMAQRDWSKAAECWQRLIQTDEKLALRAYAGLAQVERRQGRFAAAQAAVDAGLQRFPNHDDLLVEQASNATAQRDWHDAARLWRAVIQAQDGDAAARAYAELAQAERQRGRFAAAKATNEAGLTRYPGQKDLLVEQARIAARQRDWPQPVKRRHKIIHSPSW